MGGTQDFSPTWSPDSTRIAFDRFYDATLRLTIDRIIVMNSDGSGKHFVTPLALSASDPAWSPDGGEIAFSRGLPHEIDTMIDAARRARPILVAGIPVSRRGSRSHARSPARAAPTGSSARPATT